MDRIRACCMVVPRVSILFKLRNLTNFFRECGLEDCRYLLTLIVEARTTRWTSIIVQLKRDRRGYVSSTVPPGGIIH